MSLNHNDEPALHCQLNRTSFRGLLLKQILTAKPPKTIGIHGTWGTGKTSLLKQLYCDLGGGSALTSADKTIFGDGDNWKRPTGITKNEVELYYPIWFEAWEYQREDNILAALLKEIRDQLSFYWGMLENLGEDVRIGMRSILQSIDLSMQNFGFKYALNVGNAFTTFDKNKGKARENRLAAPLDSATQKQLLKDAIDKLLGLRHFMSQKAKTNSRLANILGGKDKGKRRAVIFIDDLDRCEPDTAFKILETIKVYLSLENCIFVLGMDTAEIERILARRYGEQFKSEDQSDATLKNHAKLYLEKICQDIYHIPVLVKKEREAFFTHLIRDEEKGTLSTVIKACLDIGTKYDALPRFPRSLKIFANVLLAHTERKEIKIAFKAEETRQDNAKKFFILAFLYAFQSEVYRHCLRYPAFYNEEIGSIHRRDDADRRSDQFRHPVSRYLRPTFHWSKGLQEDPQKTNLYPGGNLRQVLWITELIDETASISEEDIAKLKL